MQIFKRSLISALIGCCSLTHGVALADIKNADMHFSKQQYDLAVNEYLLAAENSNPKAYYQLGTMHYKGLGVNKDEFKALVWFSMAALQDYDNSQQIVDSLMANVSAEEKPKILELVSSYQRSFAKQGAYQRYSPSIIKNKLSSKIVFDGKLDLNDVEIITDDAFGDSLFADANNNADFGTDSYSGIDPLAEQNIVPFEQFFLIADYDVAPDGSVRNVTTIQSSGDIRSALFSLNLTTLPKPTFNDEGIYFINRSYLGLAEYNKLRMKREYNNFYVKLNRQVKQLSESGEPKEQYQKAMTLMIFPWLKQNEGDIDKLLKSAAEQGYMKAQYEYGLKLYREQQDVSEGVNWIYKAAKQGHGQAKYRLGRIFLDSPWISKDENKALFWLEEAASEGHIVAKQKAVEVKLLATDERLIDVDGAIDYLAQIEEPQNNNPKYNYLQAVAHLKMQPRQLSKSVDYIRTAIDLGIELNWDVAPWQAELKRWTSGGSVTISEVD